MFFLHSHVRLSFSCGLRRQQVFVIYTDNLFLHYCCFWVARRGEILKHLSYKTMTIPSNIHFRASFKFFWCCLRRQYFFVFDASNDMFKLLLIICHSNVRNSFWCGLRRQTVFVIYAKHELLTSKFGFLDGT